MWPLFDLEKQYAQNPSIKREEVQKLHQWLKAQPHMPELLEHEVLLFYHTCDHHMEYTKQVIDNYYTFRTHTEEFFGNLDMDSPQMRIGRQVMAGFPLDKLTDEGYCAIVAKIMDIEPSKYDFVAVLKILFSVQDMWLQGNDLIPGIVFIIDLEGLSFSQLARMSLPQIKKLMYFLQVRRSDCKATVRHTRSDQKITVI
ncbi:uncharacterized protein LOC106083120 [Stomoxys calcitrans]|uniref:uncharacterized protein LOC106083120 n=1 Tax=Stomoxys calcitrans TaxID=35570 RepID=UPI0027E30433|nr:uncharacterized protein LOC106083120 [Stomoxys calcitrans]